MATSSNDALIQRVKTQLTVDLHPAKLASIDAGVHEHLNSLLLRYNDDLDGVTLAYTDEKVVSKTAIVHPYFPLARLVVSATLIVFRPRPGARLVGVVNKLSDDFIGIVVMGFMNVVIKAPQVRSELQPRTFDGMWTSTKNSEHTIRVGDSVAFKVVEVKHEGPFVTLTGSLKDKNTGNVKIVGMVVDVAAQKEKKKKRKKPSSDEEEEEEEKDEVAAAPPLATLKSSRAAAGEGGRQGNGAAPGDEELEPKKKKRKEKDEEKKKKEKKSSKDKKGEKSEKEKKRRKGSSPS